MYNRKQKRIFHQDRRSESNIIMIIVWHRLKSEGNVYFQYDPLFEVWAIVYKDLEWLPFVANDHMKKMANISKSDLLKAIRGLLMTLFVIALPLSALITQIILTLCLFYFKAAHVHETPNFSSCLHFIVCATCMYA